VLGNTGVHGGRVLKGVFENRISKGGLD
jgi:hypothetical protein